MVGARHNINWVQGYNAQAVVGEGQIVLAAEISSESLDTANLQPMVETALDELARAGVAARPGVVLADAGSGKTTHRNAVRRRHPTLVAPDADRRKEPRPGGAAAAMTSPAECWPATGARSSTSAAKASSNRSSAKPSPTAAPIASCAAADQPSDRNGGCSQRPTTSSSFTATTASPPEPGARVKRKGPRRRHATSSAPFDSTRRLTTS